MARNFEVELYARWLQAFLLVLGRVPMAVVFKNLIENMHEGGFARIVLANNKVDSREEFNPASVLKRAEVRHSHPNQSHRFTPVDHDLRLLVDILDGYK